MPTEKALDARARRAARRVGLIARKERGHTYTKHNGSRVGFDNQGGYMLIDPQTNVVESGYKFDLSAEEVIEICKD